MMPSLRIAVFSGSFDPPTIAHLAIIAKCLELSDIDQIWVMPTGTRDDKNIVASPNDRLKMLKSIKEHEFKQSDKLIISDFELLLPQPTQTIRTFRALKSKFPTYRFWFIYGGDSYQSLPSWEQGDYLRNTLPVLLVNRLGFSLPAKSEHIRHLQLSTGINLDKISSTAVRHALKQGEISSKLIPNSIRNYISEHKLYSRR